VAKAERRGTGGKGMIHGYKTSCEHSVSRIDSTLSHFEETCVVLPIGTGEVIVGHWTLSIRLDASTAKV